MARGTAAIASSDNEETNGIIMMPMTAPAASALFGAIGMPMHRAKIAQGWGDHQHGEKTEDHRRNAGEKLEHGLDQGSEFAMGVFVEIDRR